MSKLLLSDGREFAVDKPFFTVGGASRYDLSIGESEALAFTVQKDAGGFWAIPGSAKLLRNGSKVGKPTRLEVCDRLEWDGQTAVFVSGAVAAATPAVKTEDGLPSRYLKPIERFLGGREAALALEELVNMIAADTHAEVVYVLGESSGRDRWRRLAVRGDEDREKRSLRDIVSDTVLDAALHRHEPVFVESIVGHPSYSQAESLIAAQINSVACVPLVHRGQAIGAVYLASRTPTRPLRDECFSAISNAARIVVLAERLRDERGRGRPTRVVSTDSPKLLHSEGTGKGAMKELLERLEKFSPTDLNLLVLGETGTGKELIAREIHRKSRRAEGPFVAVNCGALPPSLIESILFGHGKGAFTGADRAQAGKLQLAHGGTLFLDEIGDFPIELQVKILRAIQERQIEPIGSSQPIPVDFRIVAATHRDIDAMSAEGKFRSDLLYRIAGGTLRVPPLRERGDDASFLAVEFLKRVDPELKLSPGAEQRIRDYRWPGNVRELEQACLRAAALAQGTVVTEDDLELGRRIDASVGTDTSRMVGIDGGIANLRDAQERFTREFVARALARSGGSRNKAAAELGISERTLYRILAAEGGGGDSPV